MKQMNEMFDCEDVGVMVEYVGCKVELNEDT